MTAFDRSGERRISAILDDAFAQMQGEWVTLRELIAPLQERAFGLVILIFVLPNCLPMPGIPFVSMITGIPICLVAAQLIAGRHTPLLPRWLAERRLHRAGVLKGWSRIRPTIVRLEKFIGPRYPAFVSWRLEQAMAFAIFVLAFILALPIIAGNLLPAWGILLLAIALIERDGILALWGWAMTAIALAWIGVLFYVGTQLFSYFWQEVKHWILMNF